MFFTKKKNFIAAAIVATAISSPVLAEEVTTYSYDARGRLIKVEKSGDVNAGVKTEYQHDKASNRKKVKTTGAAAAQ